MQLFRCWAYFFFLLGELKKGLRLCCESWARGLSLETTKTLSVCRAEAHSSGPALSVPAPALRLAEQSVEQAVSYVSSWAEKTAKNRLKSVGF